MVFFWLKENYHIQKDKDAGKEKKIVNIQINLNTD